MSFLSDSRCICCSDNLESNDLRCVRGAIFSIHHKWYNIGLELDIPFSTLDAIEMNYRTSDRCLTEMLKQWLTRDFPAPTWSKLVEALSSEPVGEQRLAKEIHTQHCDSLLDCDDGTACYKIQQSGTVGKISEKQNSKDSPTTSLSHSTSMLYSSATAYL